MVFQCLPWSSGFLAPAWYQGCSGQEGAHSCDVLLGGAVILRGLGKSYNIIRVPAVPLPGFGSKPWGERRIYLALGTSPVLLGGIGWLEPVSLEDAEGLPRAPGGTSHKTPEFCSAWSSLLLVALACWLGPCSTAWTKIFCVGWFKCSALPLDWAVT